MRNFVYTFLVNLKTLLPELHLHLCTNKQINKIYIKLIDLYILEAVVDIICGGNTFKNSNFKLSFSITLTSLP